MTIRNALERLETGAIIAIGGFAGANLRYLVADVAGSPAGTLAVNVLGSLVLGFLVYESRYTGFVDRESRLLFTTGFLSSLTTYSAFALETATAGPAIAVGYAGATYGLGFAAVLGGRRLAGIVRGQSEAGDSGGASA